MAKAKHPETKGVIEVTKAGASAWRAMDDEGKVPFVAKAQAEKDDYLKRKAEYVAAGGPEKFKLKLRQGQPKKPPTAYFHFLAHVRKCLKVGSSP